MSEAIVGFLLFYLKMIALTLGAILICGLAVRLLSRVFSYLVGSGSGIFFGVTSILGTPVHELGHALFCLLFGHKIERMKLWSPTAKDGLYGFVEHSYNRKNPWARLGNLFIGIGPIFSGLGTVILMLCLCFPDQWASFLETSEALSHTGADWGELSQGIFSLFLQLPEAFRENALVSTLGLLVILSVALHISLSVQDIKGALSALPICFALLALISLILYAVGWDATVTSVLSLCNIRLLSLFALVIAFGALWVLLGACIKLIRMIIHSF